MTLAEIKNMVMFQTNNDKDDLGDFLPYLDTYFNDGYDRLCVAFSGEHSGQDSDNYPPLRKDKEVPNLPDWVHSAIADWATWLVYRNGNAAKQSRGFQYRSAFEYAENKLRAMSASQKGLTDAATDLSGGGKYIFNIPR